MNRNFLFLVFLLSISTLCVSAATSPSDGQGIAYYRAGFPVVAKPLLISEIETNASSRAEACFNLGNIYFSDNQLDSAAFYFNKGLVADPLNSLNSIGLTMLKIKADVKAAELEFINILKLKQNKKNVDIYLAIANAYLFNGVLDNAVIYQEKAKNIKTKYAPVYVVLGDIELAKKNIGEACRNYEQAIYFDDKCKEAYIKYARAYKNVNTPLAIEKLEALKSKEPSFLLVDRELADIYYSTNNFSKAAELYANYLKSGNSNVTDLTKYAFTLFLGGEFAKSLEVTNLGLAKSPRNPAFNRLAMYNNVDLKKPAEALAAANLFFNKTDNPEFTYLDYRYYGQALRDSNKIDLAIPQFENALQIDSTKTDLWKDISDMYSTKSDYVKSISAYSKYLNSLPEEKKTPDAIMTLGKQYYGLGNDAKITDAAIKKNALVKADSLFAIIALKEPTGYRGNFWRARTNSALDPETSLGLAKPFYEQTATLVEAKADVKFNQVLVECYSYLGYYYLLQKDNSQSMNYWTKILAIDPTNTTAKKASEGITKAMKGKTK
jgi:tetratricopeptide (TPR) repeat protein